MGKCEKQKVLEKLFCLLLANWATFQSIICSHCLLPISRKERGDDDRLNNIQTIMKENVDDDLNFITDEFLEN